jgi:predicted GNAT family acetyltransferase
MKTTQQISEKLNDVKKEIHYINSMIQSGEFKLSDRYVYHTGKVSEVDECTFDWMLSKLVTQKLLLNWILGRNE